jgi:aminoglycoside 6-adenylyltransferase
MNEHTERYEALIDRFVKWALTRSDLRAAFVVGSRARSKAPADASSDLDVVVFAEEPNRLLNDREWLSELGEPEITFREPTAVGIWEERRVLFANGSDADFSILPARLIDELADTEPGDDLHDATAGVVGRGYRVLVDKDGRLAPVLSMLASTAPTASHKPTQDAFDQLLSNFWYHCVWISRKLRRGELAVAHECLEGTQRQILITLIRWLGARDADTWHGVRFFESWAPEDVRVRFASTYARHDAMDIRRALEQMMGLASWLATEVAGTFTLTVDSLPEQSARRWVAEALGS